MARPLRITYPGAFYHVTSRGNERKDIFKSKRDREKFLEYFESAAKRYDAVIHVFCLMDTHYHLLLETPSGNLPQIMRHINGAYTTYFNVKRGRSGHLFQGRYKAILVDIDEYAKELSRYIHLNPVRAKMVKTPEEYEWSSYQFYIGEKKPPEWLYRDFILGYFGKKVSIAQKGYHKFVNAIVNKKYDNPLDEVVSSTHIVHDDMFDRLGWFEAKRERVREICLDQNDSLLWNFVDRSAFDRVTSPATDPVDRSRYIQGLYHIATLFYYEAGDR